ncbi:MAG: NAD(P)/FAD-dependent oxidoreductase [Phycisphaerae bacterium]|jgi:thioredoxin reductase (NADPH)
MDTEPPLFDIVIIGGGPTGLFAAFCAGLRSMHTAIIDSLDVLGGQPSALYPDKFIYDVGGHPAILARTLISELVRQTLPYAPTIILGETIGGLQRGDDGLIVLTGSRGRYRARSAVIAAGGGAIEPHRRLPSEAGRLEGKGLEYILMDMSYYRGRRTLIVGGGEAAVEAALAVGRAAQAVTLAHRGDALRADPATLDRLREAGVEVRPGRQLVALHGHTWVESAVLLNLGTGCEETLAVDAVLICAGFTLTLAPMHEWGLCVEPDGIPVTSRMETNLPGVFAAGDVVTYPGKLKLIATGFAEAAVAVHHAKMFIDPAGQADLDRSTWLVPRLREAARRNASHREP